MLDHLRAILPDEISDEAAWHLSNLAMEIATALDEIYFCQSLRHIRALKSSNSQQIPSYLLNKERSDIPF